MHKMEQKKIKVAMLLPDDRSGKNLPEPFFGSASTALLQGFEMLGSDVIEVHIISCVIGEVPAPEKLAHNIWYHQIVLPKWTFLRSLHLGPILAVRRKLREIQPDLVHSQGTEKWCAIAGCLSGYPAVLTIHGHLRIILKTTPMRPYAYWYLQMILGEMAIRLHNGIICISNHVYKSIKHQNKNLYIIPNAVDISFFNTFSHSRENTMCFGICDTAKNYDKKVKVNKIKIIVCATVYPLKNQNSFIQSLDKISNLINLDVWFFGLCDESNYCKTFKKLISDRDWCHYGGFINKSQLIKELSESTILVLPTLEDNCPMVVLEAQTLGVPVIASNVGGIPDLIEDGVTGLLVDPNNNETISYAVKRLSEAEELRTNIIKNALSFSKKYYPLEIANHHIKAYRKIVIK
jgi:glycosyltransferase involved in cell wall biosynthesis